MLYSIVGIIAIVVHLVVNIDVFLNIKGKKIFPGERFYLLFLLGVIAYHITDAFWGILYDAHLATAVFIDTTIYFMAMAASIFLWGLFVHKYLGTNSRTIIYIGFAVFIFQMLLIAVNFAVPVLFKVTEDCIYSALPARYGMLCVQILMYLLLSGYTLVSSFKKRGFVKRRYLTISLFGVFMIVAITLQVFFPLLPMYSYGYLFGICLLHSFVVEDEKAMQKTELEEIKHRVSIDPLSGVMSKHAYIDAEVIIDEHISKGDMEPFSMIVFDLNDLKTVNDEEGHSAGDKYIIKSVELIKEYFKDIPIYRVGGDEFTVILTGENYDNREVMFEAFKQRIEENIKNGDYIIVASGLADFIPSKDSTILHVFTRADRDMYARKHILKEKKMNSGV